MKTLPGKAYFCQLLRAVPACSAFFEKKIALIIAKTFKSTLCLGECGIPNALNLEKLWIKTHNYALFTGLCCSFFVTANTPLFSRQSPARFFIIIKQIKHARGNVYLWFKITGPVESGHFKFKNTYQKTTYGMWLMLSIKYGLIWSFSCSFLTWIYRTAIH